MKHLSVLALLIASVAAHLPGLLSSESFNEEKVVSCRAVEYDNKRNASITAKLNHISDDSTTLPLLIFRYTQLNEFDGLPSWKDFYLGNYRKKDLFEDNKFQVFEKKKDLVFINTELNHNDPEIKFDITETGFYCAYVGAANAPDVSFDITLTSRSSYGYLEFPAYTVYGQQKYYILLGAIFAGSLFHYILRFKVGEEFQNMNSVSLISKAAIFYILVPSILISVIRLIASAISNNFSVFGRTSLPLPLVVCGWLESIFAVTLSYFTLLFSMGYGVIYCHESDSSQYRKIPLESWKRANAFLFTNATIVTVYFMISIFFPRSIFPSSEKESAFQTLINFIFIVGAIGVGVFQVVWFTFSMIHYFRTKKTIAKFPVTNNVEDNDKLLSAFRRSFLIIFVLPLITSSIFGYFALSKYLVENTAPGPVGAPGDVQGIVEAQFIKTLEEMSFDPSFIRSIAWTDYFNVFAIVGLIFVIWTRNNYGIVLKNENDNFNQVSYNDLESEEGGETSR